MTFDNEQQAARRRVRGEGGRTGIPDQGGNDGMTETLDQGGTGRDFAEIGRIANFVPA